MISIYFHQGRVTSEGLLFCRTFLCNNLKGGNLTEGRSLFYVF
jgi:hypothetical protein